MEMSDGVVDVEPHLSSRNTIGHENHNSKCQRPKRGKIDIGGSGEQWWCLRRAGVECGSKSGHRVKFGKIRWKMCAGDGVAAAKGRMSGPAAGCPRRRMAG